MSNSIGRRLGPAVLTALAMAGVGSSQASSPSDPAGVPFVTFAHAAAAGDYRLACEQIVVAPQPATTLGPADLEAKRTACARALRSMVNGLDAGRRRSLASARVVHVSIEGDRARVTVRTTLYGLAARSTGTAILQDGKWKIAEPPSGAHVGRLLVDTIPSESMAPTLHPGDTVLVNPTAYRHSAPRIGDIIVFHPPEGAFRQETCGKRPPAGQACATATARSSSAKFVKRIVALPGDRFSMRSGHVIRNGRPAVENFIQPCRRDDQSICDFPRTFTVAAGRYYLLGDNRGRSEDSRQWGPVRATSIVGRVRRLGP